MPLLRVTFNGQLIRRQCRRDVGGPGRAGRYDGSLHWVILNSDASSSARLISRASMDVQKQQRTGRH